MNRTSPNLFLLALAAAAAQAWPTAARSDGLEMHRAQAGELDATGWTLARSTHGGFSVWLPGRFNDFSAKDTAKDGTPQDVQVVGMKTASGVKVAATALVRADGKVEVQLLEQFGKGIPGAGPPRRLTQAGLTAAEVTAGNGKTSAVMRMLAGKHKIYLLTVEYPSTLEAEAAPIVRRFMASFELTGPERSGGPARPSRAREKSTRR